jgi:uncharacterized membrane protein
VGEFVAAVFSDKKSANAANMALRKLHAKGMVIYGSAVVSKGPDGKVSVTDEIAEGSSATAVAALIGGLAGLAVGPIAAAIGAVGGALIGRSADLTDRGVAREIVTRLAEELASGKDAIVADIAPDELKAFEAKLEKFGGTLIHRPRRRP